MLDDPSGYVRAEAARAFIGVNESVGKAMDGDQLPESMAPLQRPESAASIFATSGRPPTWR